ncbi:MAG: IS1595 family transposase [Rhodospirillales bacterium]|nr:IS1595 family transposase [Rhodospirillales bacterium]
MANSPGKSYRKGISLIELAEMFPDEDAAKRWFEAQRWPDGVRCAHCQSDRVSACKNAKPMPYRCKDCRKHFSVRTKSVMAESPLPLRKWAFAIYLCATNLKGVSSMKLHRDLRIAQSSAWFMAHRIREALEGDDGVFSGPVEVDETYIGGKRKNMPAKKRKALAEAGIGRGTAGKAVVAGAKDRTTGQVTARVIEDTTKPTLQGFVRDTAAAGATLYTDEHGSYTGMPEYRHEAVNHSVGEYVRDMAHTNGMESFWAMLKRGYQGTFHHFSEKHLQRYVNEFATRQGLRPHDTEAMMGEIAARMIGRRLTYARLTS